MIKHHSNREQTLDHIIWWFDSTVLHKLSSRDLWTAECDCAQARGSPICVVTCWKLSRFEMKVRRAARAVNFQAWSTSLKNWKWKGIHLQTSLNVTLNLFAGKRKLSIQPGHIFHRLANTKSWDLTGICSLTFWLSRPMDILFYVCSRGKSCVSFLCYICWDLCLWY